MKIIKTCDFILISAMNDKVMSENRSKRTISYKTLKMFSDPYFIFVFFCLSLSDYDCTCVYVIEKGGEKKRSVKKEIEDI